MTMGPEPIRESRQRLLDGRSELPRQHDASGQLAGFQPVGADHGGAVVKMEGDEISRTVTIASGLVNGSDQYHVDQGLNL